MDTICNLISNAKHGCSNSMMEILTKFKPLIKKYAYKLEYEDAENDLIASMIQLIYDMPIFQNDGQAVAYIRKVVHNSYIKYVKHCIELRLHENLYDPEVMSTKEVGAIYEIDEVSIAIQCAIETLPEKQRQIIIYKFLLGMSDKDIIRIMGISRQAVYKSKIKGLEKLRKVLSDSI